MLGNVSLVNNFDSKLKKGQGGRYRFKNWSVAGNAFAVEPSRKFGPILWSMYSLSDSRSDEGFVLKITALTGPLGDKDSHAVELQVNLDDKWISMGTANRSTSRPIRLAPRLCASERGSRKLGVGFVGRL